MSDGTNQWVNAVADAQRQLLEMIERGQQAIVDAVERWREGGEWRSPDLTSSSANASSGGSGASGSGANNPFSPEAIVQTQFEFAERVLAAQRKFAEQLLAAFSQTGQSGR